MRFQIRQAFRALILLMFTLLLINLHVSGDIYKFINSKYDMLSQIAAFLFAVLFLIQLERIWTKRGEEHGHHCDHDCNHDHGHSHGHGVTASLFSFRAIVSYSILIFPLLTGFLLPPKTLDSSVAAKKGTILTQAQIENKVDDEKIRQNIPFMSREQFDNMMENMKQQPVIQMDDRVFAPYYDAISGEPEQFEGKKISLTGFVYKEDGLAGNKLVLSRFLITHCAADATVIGFLANTEDAKSLAVDTWVKVEGTLYMDTYKGYEMPAVQVEELVIVEEPDDPYVYPVYTRME